MRLAETTAAMSGLARRGAGVDDQGVLCNKRALMITCRQREGYFFAQTRSACLGCCHDPCLDSSVATEDDFNP